MLTSMIGLQKKRPPREQSGAQPSDRRTLENFEPRRTVRGHPQQNLHGEDRQQHAVRTAHDVENRIVLRNQGLDNSIRMDSRISPHTRPESIDRHASAVRERRRGVAPRHALHESFLVRLLADGMHDDSILHRLFDEQLDGKSFPEADAIVWIVQSETSAADTVQVDLISSGYWLDSLRDSKTYESTAYADGGNKERRG